MKQQKLFNKASKASFLLMTAGSILLACWWWSSPQARQRVKLGKHSKSHTPSPTNAPTPTPTEESDQRTVPLKSFAVPDNVNYINCDENDQELTRLQWTFRYLRASSNSASLQTCLESAVHQKIHLKTDHEHDYVGPYSPCNGKLKDPDYFRNAPSLTQQDRAYEIAMDTVMEGGHSRNLQLECVNLDGDDSWITMLSVGYEWDYNNRTEGLTHQMELNRNKVFGKYPSNMVNEEDDWPQFDTFGRNKGDKGYPVDELAGIFLHEMLHHLGFHHGGGGNGCAYTAYDCDELPSGEGSCRANSLLEIAEACVSEVVQLSLQQCDPMKLCGKSTNQIPIWEYDDLGNPEEGSCQCVEFW